MSNAGIMIFLIGEVIASYILIILIFVTGVTDFFLIISILSFISVIGIVYITLIVRCLNRDRESNKVSDYVAGFLLIIGLIIPYFPLIFIAMMFAGERILLCIAILIIFFITYIYFFIVLRRYIVKKNRRYIASGINIPFLISIIIFVIILIFSILAELIGFEIYI